MKLKSLINTWCDGGKVRGIQTPPPATIRELIDIYEGKQDETINSTVVDILTKCGIKTEIKGIGWKIIR